MKKAVFGIIIMFVGVFLLFRNFDIIPWEVYRIVISWPALLIGIGIVLLFDGKHNNKSAGIVLSTIGILFLLPRIFYINMNGFFLPVIIIVVGILFIVKSSTKRKYHSNFLGNGNSFENKGGDVTGITDFEMKDGFINRDYVFSGSKEKWTFNNVRGIEISSVFSGVDLDLTQIELSQDVEKVHIKVSSVFGGVILYVPDDWNILIQKTGVFGSFTDNRPRNVTQFSTSGRLVILDLEAVFGGGEIKCYE
jgi:predicted membrane protein